MADSGFDVKDLLGSYDLETFFNEDWYYAKRPRLFESSVIVHDYLSELEELQDPPRLLAAYVGRVSLLSRDKGAIDTDATAAYEALDSGWTGYFRNVERYVPALAAVLDNISLTLGIESDNLSAEVFVAKAGSGASMHADYDTNFAYLIRGEKNWRLAPNNTIENPPTVVLPRPNKQTKELDEIVGQDDLPEEMPENSIEIAASENTMLFLPRNWWHETYSKLDTVQINFAVKGPQIIDFISHALRKMYSSEPNYRAFVDYTSEAGIARSTDFIGNLLMDLGVKDEALIRYISSRILEEGQRTK